MMKHLALFLALIAAPAAAQSTSVPTAQINTAVTNANALASQATAIGANAKSIGTTDANSQVAVPASIDVNVLSSANTYLIYATQALAQARSQMQCGVLKCDGSLTKYWWNVVGPTNSGTIGSTAVTAGSYAVEIQGSGPFTATAIGVAACAVGCGLTTTEQGNLVTAAQLASVMP
jgi:hypothetical protein